jgi:hypothetical protein
MKREKGMKSSEKRVIGMVVLLLGLTFLTLGYLGNDVEYIRELLEITFAPDIAGLP